MKVRVNHIPLHEGLDVKFLIPAAMMNEDDSKIDETFSADVSCDLHLEWAQSDIFLKGQVHSKIAALCYRCGADCEYTVDQKLYLTCAPRTKHDVPTSIRGKYLKNKASSTDIHQESEEGLVYFSSDELVLDEVVREQVLLALPMRYLCKDDCQGLCLTCGANQNLGPHTCKKEAI